MSFFNCLFQLNHVFVNVNSEPTTLFLVIAEDKKIQREKRRICCFTHVEDKKNMYCILSMEVKRKPKMQYLIPWELHERKAS